MRSLPWMVGGLAIAGLGMFLSTATVQAQWRHTDNCCPIVVCPADCNVDDLPRTPQTPPAPPPKADDKTAPTPPAPTPPAAEPPATDMGDPSSPYSGDLGGLGLTSFDSSVGYIDNAIPMNLLRFRYDTAYNNNRATRAEFFYARGAPLGPGVPIPERSIDYQEIMAYGEGLIGQNLSVFVDLPVRLLNPDLNRNHAGFGDMRTGFKYAFRRCQDQTTSFMLQVYIPTGDAAKGLGTDHVSIEPGILWFSRLSDRVRMESELRLWVPVGGTNFAGEVLRYGVGFSYGERPQCDWWLNPVVEFVGWTVLSGKELDTFLPPLIVEDATGDTIINAKLGVRMGLGNRFDVYAGYGRALTGEVWYKDIWRAELRLLF